MLLKSKVDTRFAVILLLTIASGAISLIGDSYKMTKQEFDILDQEQASVSAQMLKNAFKDKVSFKIIEGNGRVISSLLVASADDTVFSLLSAMSKKENFSLESKEYKGMGVLVESIDGIKNGTDNKYWQYWINGNLPMVSADQKEVKNGDRIEWRFDVADF